MGYKAMIYPLHLYRILKNNSGNVGGEGVHPRAAVLKE
jgi:hypothetical protein